MCKIKAHAAIAVDQELPGLSTLKRFSRLPILIGQPLLSIGLIVGIVILFSGAYDVWLFAPRVVLVLILWILYAWYLFSVYRRKVSTRTSSRLAVIGGALTVVLLIVMGLAPMFL